MFEQAFVQHQDLNFLNEVNSKRTSPISIVLVISKPEEHHTGTNEISVSKKAIATDSIIEGLNFIKEKLGLSKIELSKISSIPRATLYKVLSGELAAEDKHSRILELKNLIDTFFKDGINNRVALKNFYVEGKNLIQLLSEGNLKPELVASIAEKIKSELPQYNKMISNKLKKDKNSTLLDPEFDSSWTSSES